MARLQAEQAGSHSVREFVRVLKLHDKYPAQLVEQAAAEALSYGILHPDAVEWCLRQLLRPEAKMLAVDLTEHPRLSSLLEPPNLRRYDQLPVAGWWAWKLTRYWKAT